MRWHRTLLARSDTCRPLCFFDSISPTGRLLSQHGIGDSQGRNAACHFASGRAELLDTFLLSVILWHRLPGGRHEQDAVKDNRRCQSDKTIEVDRSRLKFGLGDAISGVLQFCNSERKGRSITSPPACYRYIDPTLILQRADTKSLRLDRRLRSNEAVKVNVPPVLPSTLSGCFLCRRYPPNFWRHLQ